MVGGSYLADGAEHPAAGFATGIGNVPVSGSWAFTYNGSTAIPTAPGTYDVVGTFTSADANYSNRTGTATITITAQSSQISASGVYVRAVAGAPFCGVVATFVNLDSAHTLSSYHATITWGDGTISQGVIAGSGTTLFVSGAHTYAINGTDVIHVTIADITGLATSVTITSTATVTDLGVNAGKTKEASFWKTATGQALIQSFNGGSSHTELSTWLSTNFANLYGAAAGINNLTGKTNAQVAAFFMQLWKIYGDGAVTQIFTTALNVYASTTSLGGTQGATAGFKVSTNGHGARSYNVQDCGIAIDSANNSSVNVFSLLKAVDSHAVGGVLYSGNTTLMAQAKKLFDELNSI